MPENLWHGAIRDRLGDLDPTAPVAVRGAMASQPTGSPFGNLQEKVPDGLLTEKVTAR